MPYDATPTTEPYTNGVTFPHSPPPETLGGTSDDQMQILATLNDYKNEAIEARKGGLNSRDDKWEQNVNLYWNRYDFSEKAEWQAKEVMPEVPSYVDRFAAAMKEALVASDFYTVRDPYDPEGDLTQPIKRMTDVWLSAAGRNPAGVPLDFASVFEEQMKLGALMTTAAVVTWKGDREYGRVAVESVDPRMVWLDPTYRNLYRMRRVEVDRYDLVEMVKMKDSRGKPIFHTDKLAELAERLAWDEDRRRREELTGLGQEVVSKRTPVKIEEWIATVVGDGGRVLADKSLIVVANDDYIIRGPEANPYWHGRDWVLTAPLMNSPLSPYGRTYMEDFASLAVVFTNLTNLLLDAAQSSAIKAYAVVPTMLADPSQLAGGIGPNKMFQLEEGFSAEDFAKAIDLGSMDAGAVQMWQSMKSELSEAAGINEIGLGQFAPHSRTSATEIMETQSSSSAIVRSVAQTVETRLLNPLLDLIWKTGLQHAAPDDPYLAAAVGPEMWRVLQQRRREILSRPITFQARGISALIQKSQMLQKIIQLMQVISQNENLVAAFMQRVDMNKLLNLLFALSGVDLKQIEPSARERMIAQAAGPMQAAGQRGTPSAAGSAAMGQMAAAMGIGA